MCHTRHTRHIRQEVASNRMNMRECRRLVRPTPPTPFPEGEGGDLDESAGVATYAVGKEAADFLATSMLSAYGIICSVVQSIVPFGDSADLKDFRWPRPAGGC